MADQVHIPNIDSQFQRRGSHQGAELARFKSLLGGETHLPRKASMVSRDILVAEPLSQMSRDTFHEATGVDENEGGLVLANQLG